eukprot:7386281-Prymnesium_polylepis.1
MGAAARAGVVRRSAVRQWKAARWRADALSPPPGTRGGAVCGVLGGAVAGGSGRASPTASPLHTSGHSLRRTRAKPLAKARAATGKPKPVPVSPIEATSGPRAPSRRTRT